MKTLVATLACALALTGAAEARNPRGAAVGAVVASGACAGGPANTVGTWVNISPPGLNYSGTYGISEMEFDPNNHAILYAAVDTQGLWKSTDCGATWSLVGTPPAVSASSGNSYTTPYIDSPIELRIDPANSNHMYMTQGVRGTSLGFWVTTNGGASWHWPAGFISIAATTTNDVTQMSVDPTDFNHVIVVSHSTWTGYSNAGIMETHDGGATFVAHPPVPSWSSGSLALNFLYDPASGQGDSNTYLVGDWTSNGMWKTKDDGNTFTQVTTLAASHGGGQVWYASDGTLYAGAQGAGGGGGVPVYSTNNGDSWSQVNSTGLSSNYWYTTVGDGTTMYAMQSSPILGGWQTTCFKVTPQATAKTSAWTNQNGCAQTFTNGPFVMRFDAQNNIMYAASWGAGLLALKVR